jgi:transposase-like protein
MTAHQRREALHRMNAGESIVDLARTFGVNRATLYWLQAAERFSSLRSGEHPQTLGKARPKAAP